MGTGWYTAPDVIHTPGSCLTYEPQWNADANSIFENVVDGETYSYEMLVDPLPEELKDDLDAVIELLDWDKNVEPNYRNIISARPFLSARATGTRRNTSPMVPAMLRQKN